MMTMPVQKQPAPSFSVHLSCHRSTMIFQTTVPVAASKATSVASSCPRRPSRSPPQLPGLSCPQQMASSESGGMSGLKVHLMAPVVASKANTWPCGRNSRTGRNQ